MEKVDECFRRGGTASGVVSVYNGFRYLPSEKEFLWDVGIEVPMLSGSENCLSPGKLRGIGNRACLEEETSALSDRYPAPADGRLCSHCSEFFQEGTGSGGEQILAFSDVKRSP